MTPYQQAELSGRIEPAISNGLDAAKGQNWQ